MRKLGFVRAAGLAVCTVAAFALAGCDDDDLVTDPGPTLEREQVAAQYDMVEFSFDPRGSLEAQDILARLAEADVPRLVLGADTDTLQLVFTDPSTGLVEAIGGNYDLLADSVRLEFPSDERIALLVLPPTFELEFEADPRTLSIIRATATVSRERLRELVPELENEQLENPVPGELTLVFQERINTTSGRQTD